MNLLVHELAGPVNRPVAHCTVEHIQRTLARLDQPRLVVSSRADHEFRGARLLGLRVGHGTDKQNRTGFLLYNRVGKRTVEFNLKLRLLRQT